ncbi:MAG: GTPase/DUF3482 domain-containing protein [Planctomycetes bacterium]|nr:GTPase/DUF3482 domain-containing protein [Planctomycetota bacterium]
MNEVPEDEVPLFVVVGNVNQGKSSVVAALSENETIPIDSYPGTTGRSGSYVFKAGARELFRVVDTPGFQRARQALAWLQREASNAGERPQAVRAFVAAHGDDAEFKDEVELLRPILEGAGILYVVDASSHLEPANEAEMEILRWTGQPAMALINRVRQRDHIAEWRPILQQFFHIVREFDAHGARFRDRAALLRGFREIRPEWSAQIDEATAAMEREWDDRQRHAAALVGGLLCDALSHVEKRGLPDDADEAAVRVELEAAFADAQRGLEARARDAVERAYRHPGLERDDPVLELLQEDLFAETTWRAFGLTREQLAKYGAAWGAVIGGGIDLAVGGLSIFAGLAIGAGVGAAAGWFGGKKLASIWSSSSSFARSLWPGETGRFVAMGPVSSARFAWVLLDRALVHFRAVRDRSHARRDALAIGDGVGIVASLPKAARDTVDAAMRAVIKAARKGRVAAAERDALIAAVAAVMAADAAP